uniref:Uncharacterized protein n=1 Tax=Labrus bergylta TaxID=56723 RepID=A0A3Q3GYZ3_9LABR
MLFFAGLKRKNLGVFEWMLMVFVLALVLFLFPLSIWFCVKVVREHERAVIFRMGHLLRGRPRGPGCHLLHLICYPICFTTELSQTVSSPCRTSTTMFFTFNQF